MAGVEPHATETLSAEHAACGCIRMRPVNRSRQTQGSLPTLAEMGAATIVETAMSTRGDVSVWETRDAKRRHDYGRGPRIINV